MKIKDIFFIILSITVFLTSPFPAKADTPPETAEDSGTTGHIIVRQTDNVLLDNREGTAVLSGNVEITFMSGDLNTRWDNITLNCENLIIYYQTDEDVEETRDISGSINRMVATGDVKISQPDGSLFTAEKAEYFHADQKIDLTGKPVFKRGKSHIEGSILTIELTKDRVSGEDIKADLILDENR
ncbi:MAG: hypothetical protein JW944_03090 [Deltaproteobacteria bacterium]|nr:hypothetical protein [Deltaproteobacteria bacterium]